MSVSYNEVIKISFNEVLIGKREQISVGDETTFGVRVTPTDIMGLNVRMEPALGLSWQKILSTGADTRAVENRVLGPKNVAFTLTFVPISWKWLKYIISSVANAGADPFTHTFSLLNTIKSFTLERAQRRTSGNDHVVTFTGCTMVLATINWVKPSGEGGEGFITISARCVARDWSAGTSATSLSAITADPFQFRHTKFTLNNTEVVEVNNGEITIENGIDPADSRYANATLDRLVGEFIPKVFDINGRINVVTKDSTYFDQFDTEAVIPNSKLEFIRGSNDDMDFTFASFRIHTPTTPTNLEGVTVTDLVFSETGDNFTFVATDSISTY